MRELMTLEEVARYLHVGKKTVYRLLEQGEIPAVKIGHQWRFNRNSTINTLTLSISPP